MQTLQIQLIEEIEQIPEEKLPEIYDLIHYFRLGLIQEKSKKIPTFGFAKGTFKMAADFDEPLEDISFPSSSLGMPSLSIAP